MDYINLLAPPGNRRSESPRGGRVPGAVVRGWTAGGVNLPKRSGGGPSPLLDKREEHLSDLCGQLAGGGVYLERLVGARKRVPVHTEVVEDAALHAPPGGVLRVDREHFIKALERFAVLAERVQAPPFRLQTRTLPGSSAMARS